MATKAKPRFTEAQRAAIGELIALAMLAIESEDEAVKAVALMSIECAALVYRGTRPAVMLSEKEIDEYAKQFGFDKPATFAPDYKKARRRG